ncbi:DUF4166 domain-containing protein [Microbacterium terregens]|jgi:hypothetical protein|uniref:DUF4166 domain-containing protein n=1 Tax=Microbacterium terregens TaxID=69363 RepID=A0ABV5T261_9MICO
MTAHSASALSVYQRVLGDRFALLDPSLRTYFGPLPHGMVGVGHGVFEFAGSRRRILTPAFAWMAWRHIIFPEHESAVPFTVVNSYGSDRTLTAVRTFFFARRTRVMADSMTVVGGQLVDRLGRRGGLEVTLGVSVRDGGLRMESGTLRLRIAGLRVRLPRIAIMTLDERAHPTEAGRQQIDARIRAPLLGEVFRYSGSFTYRQERARTPRHPMDERSGVGPSG